MPAPKKAVTPWQNVDPAGVQYRIKDVQSLLRISRAKIYDMINRGELPPLIKLGQRASAMPQSWLDTFATKRTSKMAQQVRSRSRRASISQMHFPPHDNPCWQSPAWRTETLLNLMADYGLTIDAVCDLTDTKYSTVACWRKSVDRPISIAHLKALMFELGRGLV